MSVSREGKIFCIIINFMFAWHPVRGLTRRSYTPKYCTSSNKTLFPAVQMQKVSLRDIEATTLPSLQDPDAKKETSIFLFYQLTLCANFAVCRPKHKCLKFLSVLDFLPSLENSSILEYPFSNMLNAADPGCCCRLLKFVVKRRFQWNLSLKQNRETWRRRGGGGY